jgi:hypothetical protein
MFTVIFHELDKKTNQPGTLGITSASFRKGDKRFLVVTFPDRTTGVLLPFEIKNFQELRAHFNF